MEIHRDSLWIPKRFPPKIKTNSVKECLQPEEISKFQALMMEIRSNLIFKGNKNTDIGKPINRIPNLPAEMDPIFTSFGVAQRYPFSAADIIHGEYVHSVNTKPKDIPGEQINRKYEKPFCKYKTYGKFINADTRGSRIKKIIH